MKQGRHHGQDGLHAVSSRAGGRTGGAASSAPNNVKIGQFQFGLVAESAFLGCCACADLGIENGSVEDRKAFPKLV